MSKKKQFENVMRQVLDERNRQDEKWGPQDGLTFVEWLAIEMEELGEAAQEVNEYHFRAGNIYQLREELVQAAAVLVAWLEQVNKQIKNSPPGPTGPFSLEQAKNILTCDKCPYCAKENSENCSHRVLAKDVVRKLKVSDC